MISFKHKGNFNNTERIFKQSGVQNHMNILERYAKEGVMALASATPVDTGLTAHSWNYVIRSSSKGATITWTNDHVVNGVNIAVILQYGHGTRNGGYVEGRDYINPAVRPIFDRMANELWREVTR